MKTVHKNILSVTLCVCCGLFACRDHSQPRSGSLQQSDEVAATMMGVSGASSEELNKGSLSQMVSVLLSQAATNPGDSAVAFNARFNARFDSLVLVLSSRLFTINEPAEIINALNTALFVEQKIVYDSSATGFSAVSPVTVFAQKKGSMVGIGLLYLLLAERLNVPIYGVVAPDYFFVRFDNGIVRRNIEMSRKGMWLENEWYRTRFALQNDVWYDLRNLSKAEVSAVVLKALGDALGDRGLWRAALPYFERSAEQLYGYPDAYISLGMAYDTTGATDRAVQVYKKVKTFKADMPLANLRLGLLYLRTKKYAEAVLEFQEGLILRPDDAPMLLGLARVYTRQNDFDRAQQTVQKVITRQPTYAEAYDCLAELCTLRGDRDQAATYRATAEKLRSIGTPDGVPAHTPRLFPE